MPFRSFFLFCILKTVASYLTLRFSPFFLCTLLSFVKYREMKFDLSRLIERFQKTRFSNSCFWWVYLEFICFSIFSGNSRSWQNDVTKFSYLSPHKSFGIDWMVPQREKLLMVSCKCWLPLFGFLQHFLELVEEKNLRWFYIRFWWCRCHVLSPDFIWCISNIVITIMSFWNFRTFFLTYVVSLINWMYNFTNAECDFKVS